MINEQDILRRRAKYFRTNMSVSEALMWNLLRNGNILGAKFRRHVIKGPYILDFYCPELKLAIEVDGKEHNSINRFRKDIIREEYLGKCKIRVVRIKSEQVQTGINNVLKYLSKEILLRRR